MQAGFQMAEGRFKNAGIIAQLSSTFFAAQKNRKKKTNRFVK